ncbi:MAG TPA: hypothetical protein VFP37_12110 [Steroidobacteraceae bacterium]|nr:hypothetical protein [Steroidobacteraceae bacterium]
MVKLSGVGGLGVLCAVAGMLACMPCAYAQSQNFSWEPEDPPLVGIAQLGTGVAVNGRTAAVGASLFGPEENPETPQYDPPWLGLVNVYTTDAARTRWTLLTVLHLDDFLPENQEFGKAIAIQGRFLVVAANASLHIYGRRHHHYELLDTVVLEDATISESAAMQFERDVLAVSVQDNSGDSSVRVFRISPQGKAREVASISPPGDPDLFNVGGVSLDADARTLAVGMISRSGDALNRVHLYEAHGSRWRRTDVIMAPGTSATGFAGSLAISGNRLVVGASGENRVLEENSFLWSGAVYVYAHARHRWARVQRPAADDPAQPSYALVGFGWEILTDGRFVWITAPFEHDQNASTVQSGPASLYRWNGRRLEFVTHASSSLPGGGSDMSRRYVIEGDIYGSIHQLDGAHVVDLSELVRPATETDDQAETGDAEE